MTLGQLPPTEADVARECDGFVRALLGEVTVRSQPQRVLGSKGQADRRYFLLGVAIEFELKAPGGKLTSDQYDLLKREYLSGNIACCGGLQELKAVIVAARRSKADAIELGWLLTVLWAAKGFRRESKRTRRTA